MVEVEEVEEYAAAELDVVNSRAYQAILAEYTGNKGALSYQRTNRDSIQSAVPSKPVARAIEERGSVENMLLYVVNQRLQTITKNGNLDDKIVCGLRD